MHPEFQRGSMASIGFMKPLWKPRLSAQWTQATCRSSGITADSSCHTKYKGTSSPTERGAPGPQGDYLPKTSSPRFHSKRPSFSPCKVHFDAQRPADMKQTHHLSFLKIKFSLINLYINIQAKTA